MKRILNFIFVGIIMTVPFAAYAATASYVNDPSDCPASDSQFPGQECPSGTPDICGVTSDNIPQCFDNSTISAPTSSGSSNTQLTSSLSGGFIINCFADVDSSAPFCYDSSSPLCNRDASCYSTQFRDTTCTEGSFGAFSCGDCRTGYQDCNADLGICEVQTGVTNYDNNGAGPTEDNTNYAASCTAACDTSYLDCDGDLGSGGTGCEINAGGSCGNGNTEYDTVCSGSSGSCVCSSGFFDCDASGTESGDGCEVETATSCTTSEGASGTYSGCTCVPDTSTFTTGVRSTYVTTTGALLQGTNLGTGALINFLNSSGSGFTVFNSGALQIGNFSDDTGTGAGTLRWTGTDFEGYDGSGWTSLTSQANTISSLDGLYVNVSGDTMTGALVINQASGVVSLSASGTIRTQSGFILNYSNEDKDAILVFGNSLLEETLRFNSTLHRFEFSDDVHVEGGLTSSGSLTIEGASQFKANLDVVGTLSGAYVHAESSLTSSGTLTVDGNATIGGTLSGASLIISNLQSCDTITTDANGNLTCGAITQTSLDADYVNVSGDTMTGTLIISQTGSTVSLSASGTIRTQSGFILNYSNEDKDAILVFGNSLLEETLRFNSTLHRFEFSDELAVQGDLSILGNTKITDTKWVGLSDKSARLDFALNGSGASPVLSVLDANLGVRNPNAAYALDVSGDIRTGRDFLQTTGGTFGTKVDYTTGSVPTFLSVGDLDNDGYADLVTVNFSGNSVSIFINNGDGTFAAKADRSVGGTPSKVALGDVNDDGYADLAVTLGLANTVSIFINNGNGTFGGATSYTTGSTPGSVSIGDVNNDGYADFAVTSSPSDVISVFINDGDGTFGAKVDYATGDAPTFVSIGDVNNDGYADLAVANDGGDSVSVLINDGDGTFATNVDYATELNPSSVAIEDLDNDGYADIVASNRLSDTFSVLINDGDGTFRSKVDYTTGALPTEASLGDLDNDGYADIAVANNNTTTFSVFINNRDGTFASKVDYTVGSSPTTAVIGDLDNDGYSDVAVVNVGTNVLSVFINEDSTQFIVDQSTNRVGIGTASPGSELSVSGSVIIGDGITSQSAETQLEVVGTISGSIIHAESELTSSGTLTIEGAISTASNLTINKDSAAQDAILTFGNDAAAETLRFSDSTNGFIFSDDLEVQGTASGDILHAETELTSSGTLVVEGASRINANLDVMGTASGDILHAETALTSSGTIRAEGNIRTTGNISGATLNIDGTVTFNGVTYTWPGTGGVLNQFLTSGGDGTLSYKDINDITGITGSIASDDEVLIYDTSISAHRSISRDSFLSGLIGALVYQGTWNASTNTPTLSNATGTQGHYYVVSTAGSTDFGSGSITFRENDYAIYNGSNFWEKLENNDRVTSVFGRQGAVTAQVNDYSGSYITYDGTTSGLSAVTTQAAIDELDTTLDTSDANYVNVSGDTMTGNLIIANAATLSVSGAIITEGNLTINEDNGAADAILTFGNDAAAETLRFSDTTNGFIFSDDVEVQGTMSGAIVHAEQELTSSGTLTTEGNITINSGSLFQPVYGTDDDLILYLPFSESGGLTTTQYDRSPYGNDATPSGAICGAESGSGTGKYGKGCTFDGSTDTISITPAVGEIDGSKGTISMWVNFTSVTNEDFPTFFSMRDGGDNLEAYIRQSTDAVEFRRGDGAANQITYTRDFGLNEWHHFTFTWDSSAGAAVYQDGVEKVNFSGTWTPMVSGGDMLLGQLDGAFSSNLQGSMDEVMMYDRVLSLDEIRTQYLHGQSFQAQGAITANEFRIINTSGAKQFEVSGGAASGQILHAESTLTSSGTFTVEGTSRINANLDVMGTLSGATLYISSGAIIENGSVKIGTTSDLSSLAKLSLSGGNIYVQQTGTPAVITIDRADGSIGALAAGTNAVTFRFDSSDSFRIQSQPRADLEAQNGTNLTGVVRIDAGPADSFKINTSGNVGMGTGSPETTLHVIGSGSFTGTNARVGIGTSGAETELEVVGTISGSALTVSGLQSCDTITTDANGNTSCGAITQTSLDADYVNVSGDTMTGNLIIANAATLSVSGAIITEGNLTINEDNGAVDAILTFGNDAAAETLRFSDSTNGFIFSDDVEVQGTLSGTTLYITNDATIEEGNLTISSGSLFQPVYGTDDDLILYLPFSESGGLTTTQYDRSPYGSDGTVSGDTICGARSGSGTGKYGRGCTFDGTDDSVDTSKTRAQIGIGNEYTVTAWVKTDVVDTWHTAVGDWSGSADTMHFGLDAADVFSNYVKLDSGSFNAIGTSTVQADRWYFIASTMKIGDSITIYVDGVLEKSTSLSGSTTYGSFGSTTFSIGNRGDGSNDWNGDIDEVMMYSRVLSADEIRTHYLRGNSFQAQGAITADEFRIIDTSGTKQFEVSSNTASGAYIHAESSLTSSGTLSVTGTGIVLGNVGIGIATPDRKLQVQENQNANTDIQVENTTSGTAAQTRVVVTSDSDGSLVMAAFSSGFTTVGSLMADAAEVRANSSLSNGLNIVAQATGAPIRFYTNGTTGERMRIDSTGNVGIGSTSPDTALHVYGGTAGSVTPAANTILTLENDDLTTLSLLSPDASERAINFGSPSSNFAGLIQYNNVLVPDGFRFQVNAGTDGLAIASSGNVGIGTTSPETKLEVVGTISGAIIHAESNLTSSGTIRAAGDITLNSDNGAIDAILTFGNDAAAETLRFSDSTNGFIFSDDVEVQGTLSGTTLRITDSAGIGLGATSPSHTLTVFGSIRSTETLIFSDGSTQEQAARSDWHITTAKLKQSFDGSTQDTGIGSIFFKPSGLKMYLLGSQNNSVYEYDLPTAWSSTGAILNTFALPTNGSTSVFFRSDGLKMYTLGNTYNAIREFDLSTAWDVSTASLSQTSSSLTTQNVNNIGVWFKPDGLKVYVSANGTPGNQEVNEYDLTTAWDISTISFSQVFDVSAVVGNLLNMSFSPDGVRMYLSRNDTDTIDGYILTTPWDISTSTVDTSLDISTEDSVPRGTFFKPDGTKLYMVGDTTNLVYEYDLGLVIEGNLEVAGTTSGAYIHAEQELTSSGTLSVTGTGTFLGNVGIGTVSPTTELEVVGDILVGTSGSTRVEILGAGATKAISETFSSNSNPRWALGRDTFQSGQAGLALGGDGGYAYIGTDGTDGNQLIFSTNGSTTLGTGLTFERMRIDSSGNVGIGTTSPETALDVVGTISGSALTVSGLQNCDTIDTDASGNFACGIDETTQAANDARYVEIAGDTMTGNLVIANAATLSVSGAIITEGNLTINEDNGAADAILTFGNDAAAETLRFSDSTNGFIFSDDVEVQGTLSGSTLYITNSATIKGQTINLGDSTSSDAKFLNFITTAGTGRMYQASGGNAGILVIDSVTNKAIRFDQGAVEQMRIDAGGNVGIGTSSPETELEVVGTISGSIIHAESTLSSSGTLSVEGTSALQGNTTITGVLDVTGGITTSGSFLQEPGTPTIIGSYTNGANINGPQNVDVVGKYAYVTASLGSEFSIFDISDPTAPTLISNLADGTNLNGATGLKVVGKYAYVSNQGGRFTVIDISNVNAPTVVGSITGLSTPLGFYVSGNYAYATSSGNDRFHVIDLSDPTNPSIVSTLTDSTNMDFPFGLYVQGAYAYVAGFNSDSLAIIDISDPTSPTLVGSLINDTTNLNAATDVYVSGQYAYVTALASDSLAVIDISDPTTPTHVSSIFGLDGADTVKIAGNYAYVVSSKDDKFSIIDISDPTSLSLIGSVSSASLLDEVNGLDINGKYAYVTGWGVDTLAVIDIDGIHAPTASIGALNLNSLDVSENAQIANDLWVDNGLTVGRGGILSYGEFDVNAVYTGTGAGTVEGLKFNVTDTGIVTTGTDTTTGLDFDITRTGAVGGTIITTGLDIDVTGDTGGTSTLTGLDIAVSGADTNYAAVFNGGNVGIGTTSPETELEVVGTISGTTLSITNDVTIGGDITLNNLQTQTMTRTVPTTIDDVVDIGSFVFTSGGASLWISITVPSGSFSVAKEYLLPIQYNQNVSWEIALPISDTGVYSGNNFELDVNVTTSTTSLRIRRTAGSTAGTAYIVIKQEGVNTDAFTASTSTGSVTAPSTFFEGTMLTQVNDAVGINDSSPDFTLDVAGTFGVDADITLNADNGAADAILTFGNDAAAETLRFSDSTNGFIFSDDVEVQGTLSGSTLNITGNTTLGDTSSDTVTVNAGTMTVDGKNVVTTTATLSLNVLLAGVGSQSIKALESGVAQIQAAAATNKLFITPAISGIASYVLYDSDQTDERLALSYNDSTSTSSIDSLRNLNITTTGVGYDITLTSDDDVIITADGVGIGTTGPSSTLDVVDTSTSTTAATTEGLEFTVTDTGIVTTGTDTLTGLDFDVTRTGATAGTITTVGLDLDVVGDTGGTSTLTGLDVTVSGADTNYAALFNGGNVGIGTTSPETTLEVAGTMSGSIIHAESELTSSGTIVAAGDITLNSDNGAVDAILTFGNDAAAETLRFSDSTNGFIFSDDVEVQGTMSGSIIHAESELTSSGGLTVDGVTTLSGGIVTDWGDLFGASLKNGLKTMVVTRTTMPTVNTHDQMVALFGSGSTFNQATITTSTISFSSSPFSGLSDNFAAEYKGYIQAGSGGTYIFATDSDDASELLIDGVVVASFYGGHPPCSCTTNSGTIVLGKGFHTFVYRYLENTGGEEAHAYWQQPSESSMNIIPAYNFFYEVVNSGEGYFTSNVGIGTTSPTAGLDIRTITAEGGMNNSLKLPTNSGSTFVRFGRYGSGSDEIFSITKNVTRPSAFERDNDSFGAQAITFNTDGSLSFGTEIAANTTTLPPTRLFIASGGNIGIGTTAPETALEVVGTVSGSNLTFMAGADSYILGNVGIGITAPVNIFHVYEDTSNVNATAGLTIENDSTGDAVAQFLLTDVTRWVVGADNSDSNKFKIASSADLDSDARLTIDTSGNVGIGITSPIGQLDIQGATRTNADPTTPTLYVTGAMSSGTTGPAANNVEFRHSNQTQGIGFGYASIYAAGNNTNQVLNILSKGSSAITLNAYSYSTGNVGIATTSPTTKLEVVGTISGSSIVSPKWNVTQVMNNQAGSLPKTSSSFTTNGGTLIIYASGSGFRSAGGIMGMNIDVDGVEKGEAKRYVNEGGSHKTLVSNPLVVTGIAAGSHTITLDTTGFTMSTDANDFFNVTVYELPF